MSHVKYFGPWRVSFADEEWRRYWEVKNLRMEKKTWRRHRPNKREVNSYVDLYSRGYSVIAIAAAFARNRTTIWRHLKRRGITVKKYFKRFSPRVKLSIKRKYSKGATSLRALAKEYGCSHRTIYLIVKEQAR